ncbi:MAG: AAA family ATPase [Polyangiales bacterium]
MGTLRQDLAGPDVELVETHISLVFLAGGDVYKVKKSVDLGFLDFGTADKRRRACEAEVELNRRLSEGVYLGVLPVTRDADGRHRIDGDGETVDWAVHMRRLPDERRGDVMLQEGRLEHRHLAALASRLASFHARARCDEETSRFGTPEAIGVNVRENFEQTRESVREHLAEEQAREIEAWQLGFLDEHGALFQRRIEEGRVRDGHGDLRLEHAYFTGEGEDVEVTLIDCIEFNERFRFADTCADVAFLSMDLAFQGRMDLAERFLWLYAREANDFELYRLVDFYESYRAYVRGKVAGLLASDESASSAVRQRAAEQARRYYLLALAFERRSLVPPAVVAVGGIIASGKSTVAEALAGELQAPVVDSDRTRKFLAGAQPTQNISTGTWSGAYAPSFTDRVYAELLGRAQAVLSSGRPVIVDASMRTREMREQARQLARAHDVPLLLVECRVDREVCRARLERRAQAQGQVSDARIDILDEFASSWQEADELAEEERLTLDTARPLEANLEELRRHLTTWPAGLE